VGKLNVKAATRFILCLSVSVAVLVILGHELIDILAGIIFLVCLVSIGCAINMLGLGKYFGGD